MIDFVRKIRIELEKIDSLYEDPFEVNIPQEDITHPYIVFRVSKKGLNDLWYPYSPKIYGTYDNQPDAVDLMASLIATWQEKIIRKDACFVVAKRVPQSPIFLQTHALGYLKKGGPGDREPLYKFLKIEKKASNTSGYTWMNDV